MNALLKMAAKSCREDNSKWLSFVTHSFDTAAVMDRLFLLWISQHDREYIARQLKKDTNLDESINTAQRVCRLVALLHDIGKLSNEFQCKITDNIDGHRLLLKDLGFKLNELGNNRKTSHAACGAAILEEFDFPNGFISVVDSHHGRPDEYNELINFLPENFFGNNCEQENQWRELWEEWRDICLEKCGFKTSKDVPELNVKVQMLITALLIMSDWIASNTGYFPLVATFDLPDEIAKRADNAFEKLGLSSYWVADVDGFDFKERFSFTPNRVQQEVMDIVSNTLSPGITILEAPMGLGKTEAALASAEILADKYGCGGIYFGLPTQATANGIFERILSWTKQQCDGEKHTIRLAHGMTELNEEYQSIFHGRANDISDDSEVYVHEWFEGRKQALLADFVIGTVDQFLLASLKQKHVMLRHLGLSGKVVIIDECHAYDAYMNVYLDKALTWMGAYEVPVIILSATLPLQRRRELIKAYLNSKNEIEIPIQGNPYPVLTWTDGKKIDSRPLSSDNADKHISVNRINEKDIPQKLSEKLKHGGCAAVVVNTVRYAQKLSKILKEQLEGFEIICFHSRFTATDRSDIEKTLLKRVGKKSCAIERDRLIIVGTQVIEQSLDIDLDYMITEICPVDLLLQRSGRLRRHDRIRPKELECAELSVISELNSGTERVYDKWLLKQTERYLPDELIIPACIPELIQKVYCSDIDSDEDYDIYIKKISDKEQSAQKYCIMANKLKGSKSLDELLDNNVGNNESAEASVRDSGETIEVLLLCEGDDNNLWYLPWRNNGILIDITSELTEEEALLIARERLRLPMFYSLPYYIGRTLKELRALPERWQDVSMLKGELMLVLNRQLEAELLGRKLRYSKEYGLEEIKEGNDGQGI